MSDRALAANFTAPNGITATLAVTASTASVQIPDGAEGDQIIVSNSGTNIAYFTLNQGTAGATATIALGMPVLPGHAVVMEKPQLVLGQGSGQHLFLNAICAATQTAQLSATVCSGQLNAA